METKTGSFYGILEPKMVGTLLQMFLKMKLIVKNIYQNLMCS